MTTAVLDSQGCYTVYTSATVEHNRETVTGFCLRNECYWQAYSTHTHSSYMFLDVAGSVAPRV